MRPKPPPPGSVVAASVPLYLWLPMGVSEIRGYLILGSFIIRILLFEVLDEGSPIVGNPHMVLRWTNLSWPRELCNSDSVPCGCDLRLATTAFLKDEMNPKRV